MVRLEGPEVADLTLFYSSGFHESAGRRSGPVLGRGGTFIPGRTARERSKGVSRLRCLPWERLAWLGVAGLTTYTAFDVLIFVGELGYYNVAYGWSILGVLAFGAQITLALTATVIPIGFAVGFLVGWARTAKSWFLRAIGGTYVEFFRGMPPLVLIFFSSIIVSLVARSYFYVEDAAPYGIGAGALSLALHSAAYQAEIVRAGILSVPAGQREAADAVGLTAWKTLSRVIMPQAFRVSLPALANEFASEIKDTSLLSIIGALELSFWASLFIRDALALDLNLVFVIWTEVALLYFAITFALTRFLRTVENVSKVPGLEAAQL